MKGAFYKILILLSAIFGNWIVALISGGIALGYFFFFPKRVAVGVNFYRALFPGKSFFYYLLCTLRQYINFTSVFIDRLMLDKSDSLTYTYSGWKYLEKALKEGNGGIILMSHMGSWEIAARLLIKQEKNLRLLLYMGQRNQQEIESLQKDDLKKNGIKVIAIDEDESSPFVLVEGINFLKSGGVVSMTGDVIWRDDQRSTTVDFLKQKASLPEVPHIMSLLSKAPIFVFFAHKVKNKQYHFTLSKPLYVKSTSRNKRQQALHRSAQRYAGLLEQNLKEHPFEWYHFKPFI